MEAKKVEDQQHKQNQTRLTGQSNVASIVVQPLPTVSSQKRWLSQTRTKSILDQHGNISKIQTYPRGVYIEVGRDWAIDILDHLLREQAHEIRKTRSQGESPGKGAPTPGTEELVASPQTCKEKEQVKLPEMELSDETAEVVEMVESIQEQHAHARALASPDMMEAVDGLTALMKSEGSTDSEYTTANKDGAPESLETTQKDATRKHDDSAVAQLEAKPNKDLPVVVRGGEILSRFPGDMHFVCGCVGFSVLDNAAFLKLIENYYEEQLETDPNFRKDWDEPLQRLKVRRHVPSILGRAQACAKSRRKRQFRLWTAQRDETNGGRLQRLSEEVWAQSKVVEITSNLALLKQRLESPLRSILMTMKTKQPAQGWIMERQERVLVSTEDIDGQRAGSTSQEKVDQQASCATTPINGLFPLNAGDELGECRKRGLPHPLSWAPSALTRDWRTSLPCGNFDVDDLGECPSGWMVCREREMEKLAFSNRVSVVEPDHHCKGTVPPEKHFVWDSANRWRQKSPEKRFVCWFDSSSESSLLNDFNRFTRNVRQETGVVEKRAKTDLKEVATFFYETLLARRNGAEFFLVFSGAPDPLTFMEWAHPHSWYGEEGNLMCDLAASVVILPQVVGCRWRSDLFGKITLHAIHRIPDKKLEDDKPWWCELPLPNLPPMFATDINSETMESVRHALEVDGSVVAILGGQPSKKTLPSSLANQFVRKWMMEDPTSRFGLWISARDPGALRTSYLKAICSLTRMESFDIGLDDDLSPKYLAMDLMGLLMHMRKHVPRFQWVAVFADVPKKSNFEEWFFPPESEWWNSRGRFAFTSFEKECLEVRVGEEGADYLRRVPTVTVS